MPRATTVKAFVLVILASQQWGTACADNYDIVIYGGTSSGITAAVEAARLGKSVAIVEPSQHLGGMTTGGLSATDYGNKLAIRGLAREFYTRVGQAYSQGTTYYFEPKVAESVIDQWVGSLTNITVFKGEQLNLNSGVSMTGNKIDSIQMENGHTLSAGVFIDASYEGDLMAKSGVNYIVGRESNSTYGESHNGVFVNTQTLNVDPYVVPGNPASGVLPGLSAQLPALMERRTTKCRRTISVLRSQKILPTSCHGQRRPTTTRQTTSCSNARSRRQIQRPSRSFCS